MLNWHFIGSLVYVLLSNLVYLQDSPWLGFEIFSQIKDSCWFISQHKTYMLWSSKTRHLLHWNYLLVYLWKKKILTRQSSHIFYLSWWELPVLLYTPTLDMCTSSTVCAQQMQALGSLPRWSACAPSLVWSGFAALASASWSLMVLPMVRNVHTCFCLGSSGHWWGKLQEANGLRACGFILGLFT